MVVEVLMISYLFEFVCKQAVADVDRSLDLIHRLIAEMENKRTNGQNKNSTINYLSSTIHLLIMHDLSLSVAVA